MSKLVQGALLGANSTRTENGMAAFKSTNDACLDLFFLGSSYRTRRVDEITALITKALNENGPLAMKILAYIRDARQGTGERRFFREGIKILAERGVDFNVPYIAELGRWDDLLALVDTPYQHFAFEAVKAGLDAKNGLCAKWMPRKGREARLLREYLGLYPNKYRQLLVGLTKVVETQMCSNQWGEINYEHVPSVANIKHNPAFLKHDEGRRREFLQKAKKGEVKMNASVLMPHQIVAMMLKSPGTNAVKEGSTLSSIVRKDDAAIALWNNLAGIPTNPASRILPMCDTSGSMSGQPFLISLGLSLYLSERLPGIFKNAFLTFSREPQMQYTKGDLYERLCQMRAHHPANTNLQAAFELILDIAIKNRLSEDEMPTDIVIISDMEFDTATGRSADQAALAMIRTQYADAGYDMPNIIFWNVNARKDHSPIERNSRGVALISGASQNAIKPVMDGVINPLQVMNNAVNKERYETFLEPITQGRR